MRIAEIFSSGCGHGGHSGHGGYGSSGGYGGSERNYRHEDYYRSSYDGSRGGDRYDRSEGGGLLGIFGEN